MRIDVDRSWNLATRVINEVTLVIKQTFRVDHYHRV